MTLERILSHAEGNLLLDERRLLSEVGTALALDDAGADDTALLADSIAQLDELFLLVVVGEFNSGKSAVINALLGTRILAEGVTPTTSKIQLIRYGDAAGREPVGAVEESIAVPIELLRDLTIVDTPGTNALDRRHEAITEKFVPRSDLVVFVTSADRPFSESERLFLERIRGWGKKVVVVVNKIDIVRSSDDVAEIETYVRNHGRQLLDAEPPVFMVSARHALDARDRDDHDLLGASRLPELEHFLRHTLDDAGRVHLKLANPLGVADRLLDMHQRTTGEQLEVLAQDVQTLEDIERQLAAYAEDVDREFGLRLADVDNLLHSMEKRGLDFFDDRVRLRRMPELLRKDQLRADFERSVVGDVPGQIERKVVSIIDWLVASDLRQWQGVVQRVSRRQAEHEDRIIGKMGGGFEVDRSGMLDTVGVAMRAGLQQYDRGAEAQRVAEEVRRAVTNTALVEVGAVGLGATIALVIGGSTADLTGLLAAGTVAALGLFILPHRRRSAKSELRRKVATMRSQLIGALEQGLGGEAERSRRRILETIAPYARFVRSERDRLQERRKLLLELRGGVEGLRARLDSLTHQ